MTNENTSIKSFSNFLENLVASFNYEDFSPSNSKEEIMKKMQSSFYKDTAYWQTHDTDKSENSFTIEFKKFGNNRKKSCLKFKFEPREIYLNLIENSFSSQPEGIELSDIWMNHEILLNFLKEFMVEGMEIAKTSEN